MFCLSHGLHLTECVMSLTSALIEKRREGGKKRSTAHARTSSAEWPLCCGSGILGSFTPKKSLLKSHSGCLIGLVHREWSSETMGFLDTDF